jgi:hypothetical protein
MTDLPEYQRDPDEQATEPHASVRPGDDEGSDGWGVRAVMYVCVLIALGVLIFMATAERHEVEPFLHYLHM